MGTTRQENIKRSKAAGIPVGESSELDRPIAQKLRDEQARRERRKKMRRRALKARRAREPDKSMEALREERDALYGRRRLPGSFENGKRR
jgi:hypothetical protein